MSSKSIYLVAYYYMRPQRRAQTQLAGWMDQEGSVAYDEKVAISRNLKKSDHSMAKVILDLSKKVIVKNGWNQDTDFDKFFEYFNQGYPQYTSAVMKELDPDYLKKFEKVTEISDSNISVPTEEIRQIDTSVT